MYLFSPYSVERFYGKPFADISITDEYYNMVNNADIRKYKIDPQDLLTKIAQMQFESGFPYMLYCDNANRANAIDGRNQHVQSMY